MADSFTPIDLGELPFPDIVETLTYEEILNAYISDLRQRDPAFTALVESDPAYKVIEVCAYRELLLRARINTACAAVMIARAQGADLENLSAFFGVSRLIIEPANPNVFPPTAAVFESDDALRRRTQLALEGFSTAGSRGAYTFHALSVPGVKDVSVLGPGDDDYIEPGEVKVYIVGLEPGEVLEEIIDAVYAKLNEDDIRPLTDFVEVLQATRVPYTITAGIYTFRGPDSSLVMATITEKINKLAEDSRIPGRDVPLSAIYAALHQPGVSRVSLTLPVSDIVISPSEVAELASLNLSFLGVGE